MFFNSKAGEHLFYTIGDFSLDVLLLLVICTEFETKSFAILADCVRFLSYTCKSYFDFLCLLDIPKLILWFCLFPILGFSCVNERLEFYDFISSYLRSSIYLVFCTTLWRHSTSFSIVVWLLNVKYLMSLSMKFSTNCSFFS